jgi:hypothetical protein
VSVFSTPRRSGAIILLESDWPLGLVHGRRDGRRGVLRTSAVGGRPRRLPHGSGTIDGSSSHIHRRSSAIGQLRPSPTAGESSRAQDWPTSAPDQTDYHLVFAGPRQDNDVVPSARQACHPEDAEHLLGGRMMMSELLRTSATRARALMPNESMNVTADMSITNGRGASLAASHAASAKSSRAARSISPQTETPSAVLSRPQRRAIPVRFYFTG